MTGLIILLVILYIIIAILVIMGYIFYQTRIKHEKVYLSDESDEWIFCAGLFWPIFGVVALIWGICHCIFTFFDWFAKCLEEEEK